MCKFSFEVQGRCHFFTQISSNDSSNNHIGATLKLIVGYFCSLHSWLPFNDYQGEKKNLAFI